MPYFLPSILMCDRLGLSSGTVFFLQTKKPRCARLFRLVEMVGFEPMTSRMRTERSPN